MHDFWPFFVIFWCIFVVFLVNQGHTDCPHVCIAHVSCFQSLLRSLYYLWTDKEQCTHDTYTIHVHVYHTRWMKVWGISFAPEGKMRQEAKELVGDDMCSELVPFSFSHKDGGEVIKPAAIRAYISNLWKKIQGLLESNDNHNKGYSSEICIHTYKT